MNMKHTIISRKLSAFLLVFLLLVSAFPVMTMPVGAEASIVTVGEEAAVSAKELLSGLDMLETPQADLSATISRGDFAALLASMMRYGGFATPATGYRDVVEQSSNAGAIGFAVEQGYMSGEKGLFRPFEPITYAEAAKALVELTGNNIQKRLTTDSDYMMKASGLGILKTITSKDGNAYLSAGAAYKLATNALTASSIKMAAIEGGYISDIETGNFLEVMHSIERVSGLLTKTRYAGIYSAGGTGKNAVELDQIRFAAAEDWTEYLGCQVYAYVDFGGVDAEVLHMVPASDNETIQLTAEDIISVNSTKTEIVYNTTDGEDDDESMAIGNSTMVVWNGTYGGSVANFTARQLSLRSDDGFPKAGYVRLIDYDNDEMCDVIIIMSYETYYTASSDSRNEWISDTNRAENEGRVLKVSEYTETGRFISYEAGTEADFELIDKEQVLQVAESTDGKMITIIIGETEVEATVSEIREKGGITEYYSDGVWYVGNDYFNKYYKDGANKMFVGWHGYFKLDINGRIAVVEPDSESYWGYLIDISQAQGLSTLRQAKLFSNYETDMDAHEIQILDLAEKVQVDAGTGSFVTYKAEDVRDLLVFKNGTAFRDQLIRYTVTTDGKIKSIKTADTTRSWGYDQFQAGRSDSQAWFSDHSDFALCYDAEYGGVTPTADNTLTFAKPTSYNTTLIFGDLVAMDEDRVPYWVIPADLSDEESFNHCVWSDYGSVTAPNVKIYDMKNDGTASAIVWKQPAGSTQNVTYEAYRRVFVTEIKKVLNDEGVVTTEVTGYRNTRYSSEKMGKVTLKALDPTLFDDVLVGDLITYAVDSNNNVISIMRLFSYERRGTSEETEYKWAHVDSDTDAPYAHSYITNAAYENQYWIYSARREPAESISSGAAYYGYNAPYWGKILYENTMGVTLTFNNPYDDTENYGTCHQTFAKTNYFQWIVHDTVSGETWLETAPTVYRYIDVGEEDATEALIMSAQNYGISMGVLYLK